jgi:pimeloyl-ACP methyl ester carboxylesterase
MEEPKKDLSESKLFAFRDLSLEYLRVGSGSRIIIAFHGFGRKPEDFLIFKPLLNAGQSLVSVHLFRHGRSRFPDDRIPDQPLGTAEFAECMAALIDSLGAGKVDLLGYSLGGKVALCLIEQIPERIREVLLFAPDGLKINPLYKWTSNTRSGRALYRQVLHKPNLFFKSADLARWSGILSEKIHRFVLHHMDTYEKRKLVYDVWLIYRNFEPNQGKIREMCDTHNILINLVFGKFDRIIPPGNGQRLLAHWRPEALHVVEKGHLLLSGDVASEIKSLWFGSSGS